MPKKDAKTTRTSALIERGKSQKVATTRAKPKNVIQKVIVNVGRGGGRKSTAPAGPPRPTPLQQAMQFVQSSLARDASLVQSFQPRQGESLFQSAQVLQRLIDPINARLDLLMPNPQGSAFPNMEIHSKHDRQHVADLPDAQLVQPKAPLVPAGPMRMDDPHEEVPLNKVDPGLVQEEEEEPAQPASVQSTREDLLQALESIENSQGVKGNQKPREGFMTKRGLVTLVSNITGRQFSPSTNADYDRIKRKAISILRDMIAKQGKP